MQHSDSNDSPGVKSLDQAQIDAIRARAEDLYIGSDLKQAGEDVRALLAELQRIVGAVERAGNVWSHCDHAEDCGEHDNEEEDGAECDCGLEEIALWLGYARNGGEDELRQGINALPIYRAMAAGKGGAK